MNDKMASFQSQTIESILRNSLNNYDQINVSQVAATVLEEYKEKISRQHSYNFDYENISIQNNAALEKFRKAYFFKNSMSKKLLKAVKQASDYGMAGMLLRAGNNNPITQNVFIVGNIEYENEVLKEAFLSYSYINEKQFENDQLTLMRLVFNKEIKKYVLQHWIARRQEKEDKISLQNGEVATIDRELEDGTKETIILQYVYADIDYCPLEILENNESARSDFSYAVEQLRLASKFNAIIEKEWEYIKTQMLNNLIYNPDKTGKELEAEIEGGKTRVHDVADPDGRLQTALSYLSSGGITADIANNIKEKYKGEIRELTFSFGSMDGGNNKHTTEVLSSNVDAYKYLYVKFTFFKEFLQKLVWKILDMASKYKENKGISLKDVDIIDIMLQYSRPIEILLSMNSDGTEQDANIRVNKNINVDQPAEEGKK